MTPDWLRVYPAETPLILAMPHGGTAIPADLLPRFVSPWAATRDTDWHIGDLYAGLTEATIVTTDISRSVIDVNRDPSGASLYPGQLTTGLCPSTNFDGHPLYLPGCEPDDDEVAERRRRWFVPYHAELSREIVRLRSIHPAVVVYDCHSIRSSIPRLFDGQLPELNIGSDGGTTCDPGLTAAVEAVCTASGRSYVTNGRFRGGWTTRHYGQPAQGVHAIQMEIAMRAYLPEPESTVDPGNWPPFYDPVFAAPLRHDLARILAAVLEFAKGRA